LSVDVPGSSLLVGSAASTLSPAALRVIRAMGGTIEASETGGPATVVLPSGTDAVSAAKRLAQIDGVRYAEADGTLAIDAITPNDPAFNQLWGLSSNSDVDIDAPQAWDLTTGSSSLIVAVIDSGVDYTHPDLANQIWTNTGEIPNNGRDDDRNGYVDDVRGWNFANNTSNVRDTDGHGTHLAGTIAATMNNAVGVSGVAPGVRLMPLKFIGAQGTGAISDAVSAIYYAVREGARVINASWSGGDASQALLDAMRFAASREVVFVTAAGNSAVSNDVVPSYPASYKVANVLTVAAVDSAGNLASFSNYGATSVDVAAPGVNIYSTAPGGGYQMMSGTSMATPHVAGVAALLLSREPNLTASQVVQRIRATVKPVASLAGRLMAPGIVSAFRALTNTTGSTPPTSTASNALTSDQVELTILASDEYYAVNGGTPDGFVLGLFQDVLGRSITPGNAFAQDLAAGRASRYDVARAVVTSIEARRTEVARWFAAYLDRTDLEALKAQPTVMAWADEIAAGTSRDEVLLRIMASDEYYMAQGGGSPSGFVASLYADLLGRGVEAGTSWASDLVAGRRSRVDVARAVITSLEARATRIAWWFVRDLNRTDLGSLKATPTIGDWAARIVV
jgi:subtilisin family serine protease